MILKNGIRKQKRVENVIGQGAGKNLCLFSTQRVNYEVVGFGKCKVGHSQAMPGDGQCMHQWRRAFSKK